MLRDEAAADDLTVLLRATQADRELAATQIAEDALVSAETYLVLTASGAQAVLYGVSMYARRAGTDMTKLLRRFRFAPVYVEATAGTLRQQGFEILAAGADPDHYEVQLLPGRLVGSPLASIPELWDAARRLLDAAGRPIINPAYAGGEEHR
jgi:hypothetical protein